MCLLLYLASEKELPEISFDPERPFFHTQDLAEHEETIRSHFCLPHVIYVGSNEGCGCSFRHAIYHKEEWIYVIWEEDQMEEAVASQNDHKALFDYVKASGLETVELYSCMDGDYALPTEYEIQISVKEILDSDFFFKERTHYLVTTGN